MKENNKSRPRTKSLVNLGPFFVFVLVEIEFCDESASTESMTIHLLECFGELCNFPFLFIHLKVEWTAVEIILSECFDFEISFAYENSSWKIIFIN